MPTGELADHYLRCIEGPAGHPMHSLSEEREEFGTYLSRFEDPQAAEALLVCLRDAGAMAGTFTINNIMRGRFQCGAFGHVHVEQRGAVVERIWLSRHTSSSERPLIGASRDLEMWPRRRAVLAGRPIGYGRCASLGSGRLTGTSRASLLRMAE